MASYKHVRIFLWTLPRSVSTAFTRSMENVENVAIYLEPYGCAEHFGPEGRLIPKGTEPAEMEYTFDKVMTSLEDETLNKVVFVKDMGYAVDKRYDKIAKGFKHSFLIRHPAKSFLSYYKMMVNAGTDDVDGSFESWLPEGLGYKELWELYQHIEKQEGSQPPVLNSDVLLENPKQMMEKYCELVGLAYSDELLTWGMEPKVKWNMAETVWELEPIYKWFTNSLTAGGFNNSLSKPPPAMEDLPEIVQKCVKKSMPYYEKLNERCIRL